MYNSSPMEGNQKGHDLRCLVGVLYCMSELIGSVLAEAVL